MKKVKRKPGAVKLPCSKCKEILDEENFYLNKKNGYYNSRCKACQTKAARKINIRNNFGLDYDEYLKLKENAGECECCGDSLIGKKSVIDHDHETGAVRGVLCYNCNTMIGMAKEDASRLQKGIDYLLRSQSQ